MLYTVAFLGVTTMGFGAGLVASRTILPTVVLVLAFSAINNDDLYRNNGGVNYPYEVTNVITHEGDLEQAFLTYYHEDGPDHAS